MNFNDLRKIDVNEYIEKKNNLSYLSWAFAVDQLLQHDPAATWDYRFFDYEIDELILCLNYDLYYYGDRAAQRASAIKIIRLLYAELQKFDPSLQNLNR